MVAENFGNYHIIDQDSRIHVQVLLLHNYEMFTLNFLIQLNPREVEVRAQWFNFYVTFSIEWDSDFLNKCPFSNIKTNSWKTHMPVLHRTWQAEKTEKSEGKEKIVAIPVAISLRLSLAAICKGKRRWTTADAEDWAWWASPLNKIGLLS
jgi:hypothetical protein